MMKTTKYILFACLFISLNSCSKKDETTTTPATNNTSGGITIDSPWQYSVKIDGTSFAHVEGSQNFQGAFSWSSALTVPPDSSTTSFGSGLADNNSSYYDLGIDIGTLSFLGNTVDTASFKAFFHTGVVPFKTGSSPSGVVIRWADGSGNFWASDAGVGDQTGSSFTITDIKMLGLVFGNYEIKFKATFNCKLYNFVDAQVLTLTDGVYVGKFENYN